MTLHTIWLYPQSRSDIESNCLPTLPPPSPISLKIINLNLDFLRWTLTMSTYSTLSTRWFAAATQLKAARFRKRFQSAFFGSLFAGDSNLQQHRLNWMQLRRNVAVANRMHGNFVTYDRKVFILYWPQVDRSIGYCKSWTIAFWFYRQNHLTCLINWPMNDWHTR